MVTAVGNSTSFGYQIIQGVQEIFEKVIEKVVACWNYFVSWIQNSWTATCFMFFRAAEYISPTLSSKFETAYLYAANFFESYFALRREEELNHENDRLKLELERLTQEYAPIRRERDRLLHQAAEARLAVDHLNRRNQFLEGETQRHIETVAHLNAQRLTQNVEINALRNEQNTLQNQIVNLAAERDVLREQVELRPVVEHRARQSYWDSVANKHPEAFSFLERAANSGKVF